MNNRNDATGGVPPDDLVDEARTARATVDDDGTVTG